MAVQETVYKCFVVMPFGEKEDLDGTVIDFDETYEHFIKPIIEEELQGRLKMECLRSDKIQETGWIHSKMIGQIYEADVVIVDLTTLNPNVFYELGVRHALARRVTVLIKRKGTKIPFNLRGFSVIKYGTSFEEANKARQDIKAAIVGGLMGGGGRIDSLVHRALEIKVGADPKPFRKKEVHEYRLKAAQQKIVGVITGDIQKIKNVDVWVNSENTHMEMARIQEQSVSSAIRYRAGKTKSGFDKEKDLQKELDAQTGGVPRSPGDVLVTSAGELERTHNVKRIFHVAAVVGQVGRGFKPVDDLRQCIGNALDAAADEDADLRSIVFPLMGTGQAKGDLEEKAGEQIDEAVTYLEENPDCRLERVYFVAWSKRDRAACLAVMDAAANLESVA